MSAHDDSKRYANRTFYVVRFVIAGHVRYYHPEEFAYSVADAEWLDSVGFAEQTAAYLKDQGFKGVEVQRVLVHSQTI